MRSYYKIAFLIVPMAALSVMFQQCSGVSFKNADQHSQWSFECSQDPSKCRVVTENFNAGTSNKKIDFVWIVDNSNSMAQEVARVKNGMAAFANELGAFSDLRMALISAKDATSNQGFQGGPKYFELPTNMPATSQPTQINTLVMSNDALLVGGLALCPSTGLASDSWCAKIQSHHKDASERLISDSQWNIHYSSGLSKLNGFLRPQSHKVFVIVTDDDARYADANYTFYSKSNQFLDAYDSRFPNAQPVVYTIGSKYPRGTANYCDVYNKGEEYMKLSQVTGGEFFDICAEDWSPYFSKMLEGITILANTNFPLASVNIVDILSVKVNGVALNPGDYTYAHRVLKIRPEIMNGHATYNIAVEILEYVN